MPIKIISEWVSSKDLNFYLMWVLDINPFMPNVSSHPYQSHEPFSNFRIVGWYFFLFKSKKNFCKQPMENLIRRRILRRLIWFCTVCLRPTKKDAKLICVNGELIHSRVYNFEQYNSSYIFNSDLEPNL